MNKILSLLFIIASISYPLTISAQTPHVCGLTHDDQEVIYHKMMELRSRYGDNLQTRGAVAYVPLALHLTASTEGFNRVREAQLLTFIDSLNATYARNGIELQFYIKYMNYVNSTELNETPAALSGYSRANAQRKADAMNIYFCTDAGDGSIVGGTTLGVYYTAVRGGLPYSADWIYIKNSEVAKGASPTIEHEIGHFFTLPHTFRGFDETPFKPTAAIPCAPKAVLYSGVSYNTENYVRTGTDANCSTAGDGFCDTPADYNLGFGWTTCNYNGIAKDPTCVAVDPDESNIMGYFPSSCSKTFSPMQKAAIMNDYTNNVARLYLRNGNQIPNQTAMTLPTLIAPANNATVTSFTPVNLDWSDVAGVTGGANKESGYVIEVSTFATFASNIASLVSTTSNVSLNSSNTPAGFLKANTTYYWRIRPYGTYKMGGNFTSNSIFTTGTANAVNEIQGIKDFTVSPNPTAASRSLNIALTSEKSLSGVVKMYNATGQVVINEVKRFDMGYSNQTIDIQGLSKGVYILTIEADNGVLNKKVVVTE